MSLSFIGTGLGVIHRSAFNFQSQTRSKSSRTPFTMADKMLHAVYRVGDLSATHKFLEALGMQTLRERDVPSEKYTNAFYGFGPEQKGEHFSLELTYNYGVDKYNVGTGFGHFTVAVDDVKQVAKRAEEAGGTILEQKKDGEAYLKDPTGYCFQLIEGKKRDPLCQLMLRVTDLESSIKFYETMGMQIVSHITDDATQSKQVIMAFDDGSDSTTLNLTHQPGVDSYDNGDGYAQIAVSTPDVYKAADNFTEAGIDVARKPGPVPGIGTKICAVKDPDGWKTVLVDAEDFEKEFE